MNLQNININPKIQFEKKSLQLNKLENNIKEYERIINNNTLNNGDNKDMYSISLFPQNIDDSTIMKKLNYKTIY